MPKDEAVTGLQETLPGMIDEASPNGDIASELIPSCWWHGRYHESSFKLIW
ncbi:hypothetical protein [Photobacterium leiognathi]|uniref:hypothetical protein n=1 Tax=Photobacterium leiognathi TaxID=553611 RepID=UPI0027386A32|nr:hypothetical protein [Photobacterium leiognathi]